MLRFNGRPYPNTLYFIFIGNMSSSTSSASTSPKMAKYMIKGQFINNSTLHTYLALKVPYIVSLAERLITMFDIIYALFMIVSHECLFDSNNPTIIICDKDMEMVFGVHAMHMDQLRDYIVKHVDFFGLVTFKLYSHSQPEVISRLPIWAKGVKGTMPFTDIYKGCKPSRNAYCILKPAFLDFLQSVVDINKTNWSYNEVCNTLTQYIKNNIDMIVDDRNMEICSIEGTVLGRAFNVRKFSKSQFVKLCHDQIITTNDRTSAQIVHRDHDYLSLRCVICDIGKGTTSFVHDGRVSKYCFRISCRTCARITLKRKLHCPMCCRNVECVVYGSAVVRIRKLNICF